MRLSVSDMFFISPHCINNFGCDYWFYSLLSMVLAYHSGSQSEINKTYSITHPPNIKLFAIPKKLIMYIRGDHGDPLVQNSLHAPVHSDLWGNIRHFCKRDIFWNSMWTQHNWRLVYKGICSKIQRKNWHFSFLHFLLHFVWF